VAEVVTKSQFAALVRRDAAFVTRAIASGRLAGEALVGEGRSTRIRVAVAMEQLGRGLDLSQQLAQRNPILPELLPAVPVASAAAEPAGELELVAPVASAASGAAASGAAGEGQAGGIHGLREEQVDLRNKRLRLDLEKAEREARQAAGELVLASEVAIALRKQLAPMMATFDEVPAVVAKAMSEQHGVAYAEALITVKAAIRAQRAAWAERARGLQGMAEAGAV
jgi:hypothetical protein